MASIKNLDNPLLLLIFNKLSIQELLPGGHVCVRWNVMRSMSARDRKEMVLMIGNEAKRYIDESGFQIPERQLLVDENGDRLFQENYQSKVQLQVHAFPLDFARYLYAHFDNLTTLTISTRLYLEEVDSIIHLLEQFNRPNGSLRTLKLYSNCHDHYDCYGLQRTNPIQNIRPYLRLLSVVNSIGSLRKLTLDVNIKFVRNSKYPRIDLPILAQLEEFEFNSADEFSCLYDSITRYAVNNQDLTCIGIHYPIDDFTWLLAQSTKLSSRFTHFRLRFSYSSMNRFENLCRHFTHLTSLEINNELIRFSIFNLFRPLTHLPNLLSLVVNIPGCDLAPLTPNERGIMHFELPSVKVFTIKIASTIRSHHFWHHCNMIRVFPNVQVVRVSRKDSLCFACHMTREPNDSEEAIARLREHCARDLFRHFAHSQHLTSVSAKFWGPNFVGTRYRQWTWNEMEPFEEEMEEVEVDERLFNMFIYGYIGIPVPLTQID